MAGRDNPEASGSGGGAGSLVGDAAGASGGGAEGVAGAGAGAGGAAALPTSASSGALAGAAASASSHDGPVAFVFWFEACGDGEAAGTSSLSTLADAHPSLARALAPSLSLSGEREFGGGASGAAPTLRPLLRFAPLSRVLAVAPVSVLARLDAKRGEARRARERRSVLPLHPPAGTSRRPSLRPRSRSF